MSASIKRRRSVRLKNYDYSNPGAYFVTVCVKGRQCMLGEVKGTTVDLTEAGKIVGDCWKETKKYYSNVILDSFVVMPNHLHGVIRLQDVVGAPFMAPAKIGKNPNQGAINRAPTLGEVMRAFKARSCRLIRQNGYDSFSWQRNYYEHVVRDEKDLLAIREYIEQNPLKWLLDEENPDCFRKRKA